MPAMLRISVSGAPSRRQASFCATSESFMDRTPLLLEKSRTMGNKWRVAAEARSYPLPQVNTQVDRLLGGVWSFQVGPALGNLSRGNARDYDAAELELSTRLRISCGPVISHHNFVVFRNHVFNLDVQVREAL